MYRPPALTPHTPAAPSQGDTQPPQRCTRGPAPSHLAGHLPGACLAQATLGLGTPGLHSYSLCKFPASHVLADQAAARQGLRLRRERPPLFLLPWLQTSPSPPSPPNPARQGGSQGWGQGPVHFQAPRQQVATLTWQVSRTWWARAHLPGHLSGVRWLHALGSPLRYLLGQSSHFPDCLQPGPTPERTVPSRIRSSHCRGLGAREGRRQCPVP